MMFGLTDRRVPIVEKIGGREISDRTVEEWTTTRRWEVTRLPRLHSEQSGANHLIHDRTVSWQVVSPWEQSIVRNEIVSPPRVSGLHETTLNPAGSVDENNVNRFTPLSNETEESPAAKSARLKPVLDEMARGVHTTLRELCEEVVCIGREVSKQPSNVTESAPPAIASQITTLPPTRGENKKPASQAVSSGLPNGADGEGEKSGGASEDDKEAPKDAAAEGMDEDEEEIPPS